ncbi:hypothetical protein PMAYCL1PPCAC_24152, partial [Pristionchus mayeri]
DGRMEMMILGVKGSILRFAYQRGKELVILERRRTNSFSPLTFSALLPMRGIDHSPSPFPLLVAHEKTKTEESLNSIRIHLLEYLTRERLFSVTVERSDDNPLGSNEVFIDGLEDGRVRVHALNEEKGKDNDIKYSISSFEGTLRRTGEDQLIRAEPFPPSVRALYTTSLLIFPSNGTSEMESSSTRKRMTTVVGVNGNEIFMARMKGNGKLHPIRRDRLHREVTPNLISLVFINIWLRKL